MAEGGAATGDLDHLGGDLGERLGPAGRAEALDRGGYEVEQVFARAIGERQRSCEECGGFGDAKGVGFQRGVGRAIAAGDFVEAEGEAVIVERAHGRGGLELLVVGEGEGC